MGQKLNLAVRFLLELALLAALVVGGRAAVEGPVGLGLGVGVALTAALLWGAFVSPKARFAVDGAVRWAVELMLFAAGAGALAVAGRPRLGLGLLLAGAVSGALTRVLGGNWEEPLG